MVQTLQVVPRAPWAPRHDSSSQIIICPCTASFLQLKWSQGSQTEVVSQNWTKTSLCSGKTKERETVALFLLVDGGFCLGFGFVLRKTFSFLVSVGVGKWALCSWRCLGKSCLQGLLTQTSWEISAPESWSVQPHTGDIIHTNPCLSNGIFQASFFWLIQRLSSDWNISFCLSHCAHQREKFTKQ